MAHTSKGALTEAWVCLFGQAAAVGGALHFRCCRAHTPPMHTCFLRSVILLRSSSCLRFCCSDAMYALRPSLLM